jgi:hypothetical protein
MERHRKQQRFVRVDPCLGTFQPKPFLSPILKRCQRPPHDDCDGRPVPLFLAQQIVRARECVEPTPTSCVTEPFLISKE